MQVPGDDLAQIDAELPEPVTIWGKLLPLGLIFFCASFNLTVLQNLKDALIVTTAGAEALPFLASVGVLPATIGFFMYYGNLVQRLHNNTIFYAAILPLVVFYAFFAAVLYPASGVLHPHGFYGAVGPMVPTGIHGLLKV
jgi:AAA family ATP:ADP antiporter